MSSVNQRKGLQQCVSCCEIVQHHQGEVQDKPRGKIMLDDFPWGSHQCSPWKVAGIEVPEKKWEVFRRICFRLWSQLPKHYKYEGRIRVSLSMYAALKFWMSLRLLAYFGVEWCRMRSSYVRGMSVTVYLLAIQGSPRCPNSRIRGQWRKAPTWTCL